MISDIRVPLKDDRIRIPVEHDGLTLWLPAVVTSPAEYGPAGHCPGFFCWSLLGTRGGSVSGCGEVGPADFAGEGVAWNFDGATVTVLSADELDAELALHAEAGQ